MPRTQHPLTHYSHFRTTGSISATFRRLGAVAVAGLALSCLPPSQRATTTSATSTSATSAAPIRTDDERAVLAAVQGFFDTMTSNDSAGTANVLDSAGDFVSVRLNERGEPVVRRAPNARYLAGLSTNKVRNVERMWDSDVRVHGAIAMVWTPYDFHIDGKFSHCGVDIFNLVKKDGAWMVMSGTYTVERTGCVKRP